MTPSIYNSVYPKKKHNNQKAKKKKGIYFNLRGEEELELYKNEVCKLLSIPFRDEWRRSPKLLVKQGIQMVMIRKQWKRSETRVSDGDEGHESRQSLVKIGKERVLCTGVCPNLGEENIWG